MLHGARFRAGSCNDPSVPRCRPSAFEFFDPREEAIFAEDRQNISDGPVAEDLRAADVGARYAQALFDLAKETKAVAKVEADLRSLRGMRAESADLRRLFDSPTFDAETKGKVLAALADKAKFTPTTRKFLGLISANGRTAALDSATRAFLALAADERGVVSAEVTTAVALTAAQAKGLKAALAASLGKDPEIETRVDPSILGGMKVRVGSRLFDASLRSKLDSLRFALKRA